MYKKNEKIKKIKSKFHSFLLKHGFLVLIITIIIMPLLTIFMIQHKNPFINVDTSNDWIGFYGSYTGSIISGGITLMVMYLTIADTREIQNQNLNILKDNRIKEIRPTIDIDTPNCVFVYYEVVKGDKYKNIEITNLVFDKESRFNIDDKYQSFIKVLNLSQNTIAKNLQIEIKCTTDDILKSISEMDSNLGELPFKNDLQIPTLCEINSCKVIHVFTEKSFNYNTKLRYLENKSELFLNLEFFVGIKLKDIIKIMICIAIEKSEYKQEKTKTILYNKKLFDFEINLKYQDIDNGLYSQKFNVNVFTSMVTDKNVCIKFSIELLEKTEPEVNI